jgi:hypothetical protein
MTSLSLAVYMYSYDPFSLFSSMMFFSMMSRKYVYVIPINTYYISFSELKFFRLLVPYSS